MRKLSRAGSARPGWARFVGSAALVAALGLATVGGATAQPLDGATSDVTESAAPAPTAVEAPVVEAPVVEAPVDAPVVDVPVTEAPAVDAPVTSGNQELPQAPADGEASVPDVEEPSEAPVEDAGSSNGDAAAARVAATNEDPQPPLAAARAIYTPPSVSVNGSGPYLPNQTVALSGTSTPGQIDINEISSATCTLLTWIGQSCVIDLPQAITPTLTVSGPASSTPAAVLTGTSWTSTLTPSGEWIPGTYTVRAAIGYSIPVVGFVEIGSSTSTFTVEAWTAPSAAIAPISNPFTTQPFTISGTAEPGNSGWGPDGATVALAFHAASTSVYSWQRVPVVDGAWSLTVDPNTYAAAAFTVSATVASASGGNTSAKSAFTIIQAEQPTVTFDAESYTTFTNRAVTLTGTATPGNSGWAAAGAQIAVAFHSASPAAYKYYTVPVDTSGTWTLTVPANTFPEATLRVRAEANSAFGGKGEKVSSLVVVKPTAPVVTITDEASSVFTNRTLTLTGTAEPGNSGYVEGETVYVELLNASNAKVAFNATVPVTAGAWTTTFDIRTLGLPAGEYRAKASVRSNAGGNGSDTAAVSIIAPTAPIVVINEPVADVLVGGTIEVSGTATPGNSGYKGDKAVVYLEIQDTTSGKPVKLLGFEVAVVDGVWSGSFSAASLNLAPGTYAIKASASSTAGGNGSDTTAVTVIDLVAPGVAITSPSDGEVLPEGDVTVTGTVTSGSSPLGSITVTLAPVRDVPSTERSAARAADPTLEVVIDEEGNWTTVFTDVPAGRYTVTATVADESEVSASTGVGIIVQAEEEVTTPPIDGRAEGPSQSTSSTSDNTSLTSENSTTGASTTATATATAKLPTSGASPLPMAAGAIALLIAGAAALMFTRRRALNN